MNSHSPLLHILKGLVPCTEENLHISYSPNEFFNKLERLDKAKKRETELKTFKSAYYHGITNGYIGFNKNGLPILTNKGQHTLQLFEPKKLNHAKLMVTFDIPEVQRHKREELRRLLRILKFKQVQRSAWISDYDGKKSLLKELKNLISRNLSHYTKHSNYTLSAKIKTIVNIGALN